MELLVCIFMNKSSIMVHSCIIQLQLNFLIKLWRCNKSETGRLLTFVLNVAFSLTITCMIVSTWLSQKFADPYWRQCCISFPIIQAVTTGNNEKLLVELILLSIEVHIAWSGHQQHEQKIKLNTRFINRL